MSKKKKIDNVLMYKGRPLVRKDNVVYYGFSDDKYLIALFIKDTEEILNTKISTKVVIHLLTNETNLKGKERIIKKAERDGLFSALDIGAIWLEDAISH